MRGQKNLFTAFCHGGSLPGGGSQKGNREALKARNTQLLTRYYYYTVILKVSYIDAIKALKNEIYLSEISIVRLIEKNIDQLKEFHKLKPTRADFKQQYPHIRW